MIKNLFARNRQSPGSESEPSEDAGTQEPPAEAAPDAPAADTREGDRLPTHEQIAVRAYELWVSRGRPEGTDRDDWAEAERQLRDALG